MGKNNHITSPAGNAGCGGQEEELDMQAKCLNRFLFFFVWLYLCKLFFIPLSYTYILCSFQQQTKPCFTSVQKITQPKVYRNCTYGADSSVNSSYHYTTAKLMKFRWIHFDKTCSFLTSHLKPNKNQTKTLPCKVTEAIHTLCSTRATCCVNVSLHDQAGKHDWLFSTCATLLLSRAVMLEASHASSSPWDQHLEEGLCAIFDFWSLFQVSQKERLSPESCHQLTLLCLSTEAVSLSISTNTFRILQVMDPPCLQEGFSPRLTDSWRWSPLTPATGIFKNISIPEGPLLGASTCGSAACCPFQSQAKITLTKTSCYTEFLSQMLEWLPDLS